LLFIKKKQLLIQSIFNFNSSAAAAARLEVRRPPTEVVITTITAHGSDSWLVQVAAENISCR
jgi:hypothetical protein